MPSGASRADWIRAWRRSAPGPRVFRPRRREAVAARLDRFAAELEAHLGAPSASPIAASATSCSAAGISWPRRSFNAAVDDYCALVGLPPGLIENVTDGDERVPRGDRRGRPFPRQRRSHRRRDAAEPDRRHLLIAAPPTAEEAQRWATCSPGGACRDPDCARGSSSAERASRRGGQDADMIVYAPGTQHSSLFPSYLTPGLSTRLPRT